MKRWIVGAAAGLVLATGGVLVHTNTVGVYNGLNKGVFVGDYGLEFVGEPGFFHDDPGAWKMDPCAQEDSPGPCYWDATVRGNGYGQSFYVGSDQVVHY